MPMGTAFAARTLGERRPSGRASGALTNDTNRDSLSGSSSTPLPFARVAARRGAPSPPRIPRPDAERVVARSTVAQVVEAAVERLEPRRGALQPVGGADVEHQEPVDVADQRLGVEVAGQQLRRAVGVMPPLPPT